ncbi:MAG TPA: hypothetical protein VFZ61_33490 [Polyangiales bacterium]
MTRSNESAAFRGVLGVIGLLAACAGSPTDPQLPAGEEDDKEEVPEVDTQQTQPLVRRAELHPLPSSSSVDAQAASLFDVPCQASGDVPGQLDESSYHVEMGTSRWLVDAYVVTALESGVVSIASRVEPMGDAYVYGYGYPLNAQRVELGASLPTLSPSLIPGASLPDTALDDGKARMDLTVEAGTQYVVTFKALVGPASKAVGWRYQLGLCAEKLRVDGKLWVAADVSEQVPATSTSAPISLSNAEPGAMGALVQALATR